MTSFVLGAYLSKGGKSFICCSSTFKNKAGELQSRILDLKSGSIVTDTRANLHYLVTEYGKVNLKVLQPGEMRGYHLRCITQFRDQLIKEAEKMHIWRQSNKIDKNSRSDKIGRIRRQNQQTIYGI